MSASDTPRTDAFYRSPESLDIFEIIKHARTLERELRSSEAALAAAKAWSDTLSMWGDTPEIVHEFIKGQQVRIHHAQDLEAELAAARVDGERLDWLEMHASVFNDVYLCRYPFAAPNQDRRWMMKINYGEEYAATARAAIDAARKPKAVDCKEESP